MKCKGPCLPHCYNKNKILFLLIGIILGIVIRKEYLEQ